MTLADYRTRVATFDRRLAAIVTVTCVALLGAIVALISVSVFSRFIIFNPLNFADPMSKYMMQWMAFLGVGLAIRSGEHVFVDMLATALPLKYLPWLQGFLNILLSILFAVIVYNGCINALSARTSQDPFVFGISMMIPYFSVPVGMFYALVQINMSTFLALTDPDPKRPANIPQELKP